MFQFSETSPIVKKKKSKKSIGEIACDETLGKTQIEIPFFLKPSEKIAAIDSSKWPLLLKVKFFILLSYHF